MMTQTGIVAAAWLLTATQTDLYQILITDPASRTREQAAQVKDLGQLDAYVQDNLATLKAVAQVMAPAKNSFKTLLNSAGYTGSSCPGGAQVTALAEQGV